MKKALLVIGMQNVCVWEKHAAFFKYNNEILIQAVNEVIDANENNLVIYIKNVMKKKFINKFAPFQAYEGTEGVELVRNLRIASNYVFTKNEGNAFTNSHILELAINHKVNYVLIDDRYEIDINV